MNYATAKRDGYTVPIIGIPQDATEEKCEACGRLYGFEAGRLVDGGFICHPCAKQRERDGGGAR